MFQLLIAVYYIVIVAMLACIGIIWKSSVKNWQSMTRLIGVGALTAVSYTLSTLVPAGYLHLAVFMNGLYFIGTDWLAFALIFFTADYTRVHPATKLPGRILVAVAVLDTVSLLLNTFTRHVFDLTYATLGWMGYWQIQSTTLHYIHMGFGYLMIAYCMVLLVYRLIVAPNIYKGKYGAIVALLVAVAVLNLACVFLQSGFDYSVLIYGLFSMAVSYYVLYASPKRLLQSMNSKLVENSAIGLMVFDEDGHCAGINQMARSLLTGDGDVYDAADQYFLDWNAEHKDDLKSVMGVEWKIQRDGQSIYLYVNYQQLLDKKNHILGYSFQFEDRTEVVTRYRQEKYRATHDLLTGLLNRDAFEEAVGEILAKSTKSYCMVCSNITDFKLINELCGTDVGDALLVAQADIIRRSQSEDSVSTRMYADKFCTLLPEEDFSAEGFKEAMLAILENKLSVPLKTHCVFGVYHITDTGEPVWTMCDKAMMAIDSVRDNYGQYFCVYQDEMFQRIIREKEILGEFDQAIAEEQFHMYLQPQIAHDGTIVGAEALVRWIHPDKGMISPGDFIPVLEKAGLIHKLDLYMWEKAAQKLEEWKKAGKDHLCISVNISTKDFYLINIQETFHALSEKYDFDIKNLKLEITESALMHDIHEMIQNMDGLHSLGYDIEIDDFGSGYSSLGRLKDIYADILKIDMIFLQQTENAQRSETIIKNVIAMAKELGMPVITEGVETREQAEFLRSVGCDMFQGFYFARPMSVENFEEGYMDGKR